MRWGGEEGTAVRVEKQKRKRKMKINSIERNGGEISITIFAVNFSVEHNGNYDWMELNIHK